MIGGDCGCGGYGMVGGSLSGGKRGKKLETDTKKDLYEKAKRYDVNGRSKMNKQELVTAVRRKQQELGQKLSRRKKTA